MKNTDINIHDTFLSERTGNTLTVDGLKGDSLVVNSSDGSVSTHSLKLFNIAVKNGMYEKISEETQETEASNLSVGEGIVLKSIIEQCDEDYSANVKAISDDANLTMSQVKGFIGSLVKKSYVQTDKDTREGIVFNDVWPLKNVDGEWVILSWGEWS